MNKTEKFWDRLAANFDGPSADSVPAENKTLELTRKYLTPNAIVLDYGCATGSTALQLAEHVRQVHGIDISSKMIAIAQCKATERQIANVDFVQATLFDERYQPASFDLILAFNILHLLDDTQKVIQRMNELLKPGGLMISETACLQEKSFKDRLIFILLSLVTKIGIIPYVKFLNTSQLEAAIVAGGFQIVETERLSSSPTSYFIVAKKK